MVDILFILRNSDGITSFPFLRRVFVSIKVIIRFFKKSTFLENIVIVLPNIIDRYKCDHK